MKIQKKELAQKLNKVKMAVPKKPIQVVLQGVLVKDGYLIGNNLETTIKAKLEGTEGECFIIPERAFDLINNLPDGEVDISLTSKDTITIKADRIKNKYQTMDSAQFPIISAWEDGNELAIDAEVLLESMKRVSYAIPAQGTNAAMNTMCLQATEGQLNFVGLDGHVLAWDKVDYDGEFQLLIPKNTVEKIKSLGITGEVRIKHNKMQAVFVTEEYEIYTRLIEGQYFKYKTMFNQLPLHTVISRENLLEAITRAKMCTDELKPVRFEIQGSSLNLSIRDSTTNYDETVDLQEEFSEKLVIGFNAKLVMETLKAFDCENVGITFGGAKMPMIVEAEDSDFKAIVLPVAME